MSDHARHEATRARMLLRQREQMLQTESRKTAESKRTILERLKPEAAGRYIRNLIQQKKTADTEPEACTISPEETTSDSSSATITSKHLGPSDGSSSTTTVTITEDLPPNEPSLKRKRTDDEEEVDEVAERVKRLKMERKSLWESFDDSQFNMHSGLLYDAKLWEWYW
ncbi:hypothetical protein M409DRAFT_24760 [Zasmidium cellare ATCC 36951]|uniref:Uncharacterized protein n=1 Tax=Zasmidium cellare ATCC 36951 TaxID=1080233 RepID=A0A6A6CCQ8_ZASCE|nr:uncharacterized protein M409DRAFT_24760 [Zasmidium cellare ATCC 36951]KAF2164855.1 hypothetical protein M409DRAFT_24760 [Zasmidium cellare ATCC 36951]